MKPTPTDITLDHPARILEISFSDQSTFRLPCEFLRVNSPSAEVKGHAPGQEVLQVGKEQVNIDDMKPVGNYALQIFFDDAHNSGLFTWDMLYDLGKNYESYWADYLDCLKAAGHTRKSEAES
jgi:DUF971 family protein